MLLDRYRELLTAYVDGELTNRQRRHVAQLLRRSAEARLLLRQLQEDAAALRRLPPPPVPIDLTGPVLRTIHERRLTPGGRRAASAVKTFPAWMAPLATWAAAAAVLLVLGAGSYLYFAASLAHKAQSDLARQQADPQATARAPEQAPKGPGSPVAPREDVRPAPVTPRPSPRTDHPAVAKNPPAVKDPGEKPKPSPTETPAGTHREETLLTDRMELFRIGVAEPLALPVVLKVADLDQDAVRRKLIAELGKDANFRLELPCKHGTRAVERVGAAARAVNLGLVIEKHAQDRLKRPPQWKTNYVVYLEGLTPEELARFLQKVGAEDRKSAARKPPEGQFDRLVLTRMTASDHKELSALLGVDPTQPAPPKGPLGTDLHQPLSGLTDQQVGRSLAGQGGTPRSEAGKPPAKAPEHLALVLAYNPVRPSPGSPEIQRFLESRKPARPGTVRVLLVLRG